MVKALVVHTATLKWSDPRRQSKKKKKREREREREREETYIVPKHAPKHEARPPPGKKKKFCLDSNDFRFVCDGISNVGGYERDA